MCSSLKRHYIISFMELVHIIIFCVTFVAGRTAGSCADGACRAPSQWTLEDAASEILKIQNLVEDDRGEGDRLRRELDLTYLHALPFINSRVPVGYTYIQYYGQPDPTTLWPWPNHNWQDVSSLYAEKFFRVAGCKYESWGVDQTGCVPRITQMESRFQETVDLPNLSDVPVSGWSDFGGVGSLNASAGTNMHGDGLRFYTRNCEIRPSNQAIRIWKRRF